jgi:hypothetical protein
MIASCPGGTSKRSGSSGKSPPYGSCTFPRLVAHNRPLAPAVARLWEIGPHALVSGTTAVPRPARLRCEAFHTPLRTARNKRPGFAVLAPMIEILIGGVALLLATGIAAAIAPKRPPNGQPWPGV